jgi:hypothetical protein
MGLRSSRSGRGLALTLTLGSVGCATRPAIAPTVVALPAPPTTWARTPDVAAYWNVAEGASWSGLLRIERGLTLEEARAHAAADPEVTYFFFTTGGQMVLEPGRADRTFQHGDTAFFRGEHWWGSAPGLADGYAREAAPAATPPAAATP